MRSRVLVPVVLALVLAACTPDRTVVPGPVHPTEPIPAVDVSATPAGRLPVAYGDARVSEPESFPVSHQSAGPCESGLLLGPFTRVSGLCGSARPESRPDVPHTPVLLGPMRRVPSKCATEEPAILDGVSVHRS